jgi:predicted ATP-grasp superfamily ATP-dependent carboligase
MIKARLSPKIATNDNHYFFSMLSDRFIPLNKIWAEKLEQRFGHKFKPIFVLPFWHNKLFEEENYLILNEKLEKLHCKMNRDDIIDLIYPEDLNQQFSESSDVKKLIKQLSKKQGKVYILAFSSVWLKPLNENVIILGPNPEISAKFDAKITHHQIFKELGLPCIKTAVYRDINKLRAKQKTFPFFLSAMYSSGGIESKAIFTNEDLTSFYAQLRPINQSSELIVSDYLNDIVLAPNTSSIVTSDNKATVVCLSDQIMRSNAYLGNIYPSQAAPKYQKMMIKMTEQVGRYLGKQGFRGLFGLDFLITKSGKCYPTDINPRRQGGYYCNVMASPCDIIDLEMRLIFDELLPKISYNDFQCNYVWAHSKLSPYYQNTKITAEFCDSKPDRPFYQIGATHKAIYYPKDYTLLLGNPGFYLTSGRDYNEVKNRLHKEVETVISTSYNLYDGK